MLSKNQITEVRSSISTEFFLVFHLILVSLSFSVGCMRHSGVHFSLMASPLIRIAGSHPMAPGSRHCKVHEVIRAAYWPSHAVTDIINRLLHPADESGHIFLKVVAAACLINHITESKSPLEPAACFDEPRNHVVEPCSHCITGWTPAAGDGKIDRSDGALSFSNLSCPFFRPNTYLRS